MLEKNGRWRRTQVPKVTKVQKVTKIQKVTKVHKVPIADQSEARKTKNGEIKVFRAAPDGGEIRRSRTSGIE